MLPFAMSVPYGLQRGVFQLKPVRFILEQRRKPLLTFGRRCRRIPRHLPRMAQELPREWRQRVAANTQGQHLASIETT